MRRLPRAALSSRLHCGDNLPYMAGLPDGCCDLIYIDPPFCTRTERRGATESATFDDRWPAGTRSYLPFMRPRLEQCGRLLAGHGTLYVHVDWRVCHHVRSLLDGIFGPENFLNEIIWHYRTGGLSARWFGRKHDTILAYARTLGRHRFNVIREGAFRTDGLKCDEQGRPYKSTRKGRLYFHADGPALTDVWEIPFLSTVSLERTGWPAQKPLALMERIIKASTRPGDVVADFFCGSGTTLVAAKKLSRRWLGCDISKQAIAIADRRLSACR
ncbi:MAG TPA: site-specific DNA-methyltransferase [Phycisphaerae bacterium]|nr:site-specific DNA-methyltransferase [Phycisphaerae bacterium]